METHCVLNHRHEACSLHCMYVAATGPTGLQVQALCLHLIDLLLPASLHDTWHCCLCISRCLRRLEGTTTCHTPSTWRRCSPLAVCPVRGSCSRSRWALRSPSRWESFCGVNVSFGWLLPRVTGGQREHGAHASVQDGC
jgi:hypothetical protein